MECLRALRFWLPVSGSFAAACCGGAGVGAADSGTPFSSLAVDRTKDYMVTQPGGVRYVWLLVAEVWVLAPPILGHSSHLLLVTKATVQCF